MFGGWSRLTTSECVQGPESRTSLDVFILIVHVFYNVSSIYTSSKYYGVHRYKEDLSLLAQIF